MILKQIAMRKWVVMSASVSTNCYPSQLLKAVISRNQTLNAMNRTDPAFKFERCMQDSNHLVCDDCLLKLSNSVRCDGNRYSTGDSKTGIQKQCCSTWCSKIEKKFRKQAGQMHAIINKHALLCVYQDPHYLIHRNFCNKSSNGKEENMSWEYFVNYDKLSPLEVKIHEKHKAAVKKGKLMYIDPQTGYHVMTRLAHLQRGDCCGNACRHCPYGQEGVNDPNMKKTFNTAFYV